MVHFTGLLENARHPVAGPLLGDPCKNWLPARIGGWPGTATGGQIHVVHISHTDPPKEIIQALRKYLLGKIMSTNLLSALRNNCTRFETLKVFLLDLKTRYRRGIKRLRARSARAYLHIET